MRIVVIGGGPAGLYFAMLARRADPTRSVTVLERNPPDETFGWGVVFSDATLDALRTADPASHAAIEREFAHWDDIDIHVRGHTITSTGHGFSGLARRTLLRILRDRARAEGVHVEYAREVASLDDEAVRGADLIVAADGANSTVRRMHADWFAPTVERRRARYIWLGTTLPLDAFTFCFVDTPAGVVQAHAYRFDRGHTTFIVECSGRAWVGNGFDRMDARATVHACERLFAPWLAGHPLLWNAPHRSAEPWERFAIVRAERWWHDRVVLVGDAAHTAHFSIGSGTKLAMEDAIALAAALDAAPSLPGALARYQEQRQLEALRLQNAARNSMEWFEHVDRYIDMESAQFAYSLLTRSQRVGHENLRLRDAGFVQGVERWIASRASRGPDEGAAPAHPRPPMFTPFALRGLTLANRVVVAPMDMYCAEDGTPNDFHLIHLGARALGGAALVMTEMTCVSPEGRITPGCTGMYAGAHVEAWRRITNAVHRWSPAAICLQLGHSGRKGATKLMWEGMDEPLERGAWETIAPSPLPWAAPNATPRAMDAAMMRSVRDQFVRATAMAIEAGFDMVELHCAHGYLLSSFITPLSNHRTDCYGGSLANRMRFPLEVFAAMRAAWPAERPMSVRISATDWVEGGVDGEESVAIARAFAAAGADIIHVSTGQTSPDSRPVYGRMFQTPYSDRIRNEAHVPTIAVGNVTEPDQVNAIIAAGRADLVALARPHLHDPNWTQHAAAQLGVREQWWPVQYGMGRSQLERLTERARAEREP